MRETARREDRTTIEPRRGTLAGSTKRTKGLTGAGVERRILGWLLNERTTCIATHATQTLRPSFRGERGRQQMKQSRREQHTTHLVQTAQQRSKMRSITRAGSYVFVHVAAGDGGHVHDVQLRLVLRSERETQTHHHKPPPTAGRWRLLQPNFKHPFNHRQPNGGARLQAHHAAARISKPRKHSSD